MMMKASRVLKSFGVNLESAGKSLNLTLKKLHESCFCLMDGPLHLICQILVSLYIKTSDKFIKVHLPLIL